MTSLKAAYTGNITYIGCRYKQESRQERLVDTKIDKQKYVVNFHKRTF